MALMGGLFAGAVAVGDLLAHQPPLVARTTIQTNCRQFMAAFKRGQESLIWWISKFNLACRAGATFCVLHNLVPQILWPPIKVALTKKASYLVAEVPS